MCRAEFMFFIHFAHFSHQFFVQHYYLHFPATCDILSLSRGDVVQTLPILDVGARVNDLPAGSKKNVKNPLTNRTRCAIMSTSRGELLKTNARDSGQQKLHELKPRPNLPVDHTHSEVVKQDGAVGSRWGTETSLLSLVREIRKKSGIFLKTS